MMGILRGVVWLLAYPRKMLRQRPLRMDPVSITARSLFRFNQQNYRSVQRERWLLDQFESKSRRAIRSNGPDLLGDEILLSEGIVGILHQLGRLPSFDIALRRCCDFAPRLRPIIGQDYLEEYRLFLDRCPRYMNYLAVIESQRQWLLWVASSSDVTQ